MWKKVPKPPSKISTIQADCRDNLQVKDNNNETVTEISPKQPLLIPAVDKQPLVVEKRSLLLDEHSSVVDSQSLVADK